MTVTVSSTDSAAGVLLGTGASIDVAGTGTLTLASGTTDSALQGAVVVAAGGVVTVGTTATVLNATGGSITNAGEVTVEGTFEQDAGTVATGSGDNPVALADGSSLDLAGTGAGAFSTYDDPNDLNPTIGLSGNVAAGQSLEFTALTNGTTTVNPAGSFTNSGTITVDHTPGGGGAGGVALTFPAATDNLTNEPGATIDFYSVGTGDESVPVDTVNAGIINQGTINLGGGGDNGLTVQLTAGTFTNSGTITIAATPDTYYGTPTTFDLESGTIFANASGGSVTIQGSGSFVTYGTFQQQAGTVETGVGDYPVDLADGSSLDLAGTGAGSFSTYDDPNDLNPTIGLSGNVAAGQSLELTALTNGTTTVNLAGSFTNSGTITVDHTAGGGLEGGVALTFPAAGDNLTNEPDATIDVYGPATNDESVPVNTINGSVVNQATINIGGGSQNGTTFELTAGTLTNDSSIVIAGAPDFYYGTAAVLETASGATITNPAGGTVTLDGEIDSGGTFNADAGTITLGYAGDLLSAGQFNFDGTLITGGSINASGGTLADNSPVAAAFDVLSGADVTLTGNVSAAQTLAVDCFHSGGCGGGGTILTSASGFTNAGTITVAADYVAPAEIDSGGRIDNTGTITFATGPLGGAAREEIDGPITNEAGGTIDAQLGDVTLIGAVTNDGSLQVTGGSTMDLTGGLTNAEGSSGVLSGGSYLVTGNSTTDSVLQVSDVLGGTVSTLDASFEVGPDAEVYGSSSGNLLDLSSIGSTGVLTLDPGASAPVAQDLTNSGSLVLQSTAVVDVTDYTQTATGTLTTHVAGTPSSGDLGTVAASGTANLAGTLDIVTDSPFVPATGAQYIPVTGATVSGTFGQVNGTSAGPSATYTVAYTATSVELNVVNTAVDIAVESVTGPSAAQVGAPVTIDWTVKSLQGTATAPWTDTVYVSPSPSLGPDSVILGSVVNTTTLAPGSSYDATLTADLPGITPGTWYFLVVADSRDQLADANRANATGASVAATVTMTTLTPGASTSGTIPAGEQVYVAINPAAGTNVQVTATFGAADTASMFEAFGRIAGPANYDQVGNPDLAAIQDVLIADAQSGTYYIDLDNPTGTAVTYQLTTLLVTQEITTVSPTQAAYLTAVPPPVVCTSSGNATSCLPSGGVPTPLTQPDISATINGVGFTPATTATLSCSGLTGTSTSKIVPAATATYVSPTELYADFGPSFSPTGVCSVEVTTGTDTSTLASAVKFTDVKVTEGNEQSDFEPQVSISAPSINRPDEDAYGMVNYTNPFPYEIPAPLMQLTASGATLHFAGEPTGNGSNLLLLGVAPAGDPAVLAPGQSGSVEFVFDSTLVAHQTVQLTIAVLNNPGASFDLGSLFAAALPTGAPAALASYLADQGALVSAGQLQQILDDDVTHLSSLGETVSDVDRLFTYELNKITNYGQLIVDHTDGPFGFGLPGPVDRATVDGSGNVTVTDPTGASLQFMLLPGGGYSAGPGSLSELNGNRQTGWTLTDPDQTSSTFNPAGLLVSSTDDYGQPTTYAYSGSELVSSTSPAGDVTTYGYDSNGHITSVTDGQTGHVTTLTYDPTGRLSSLTAEGATIHFAWNSSANLAVDGTLASTTSAQGVTYTYGYDPKGQLTSVTRGDGTTLQTVTYPAPGEVVSTDAEGNSTDLYLNEDGTPVKALYADGTPAAEDLNSAGDPDGLTFGSATLQLQFDSAGDLTGATGPLGYTSTFAYSRPGVLSGYSEPLGQSITVATDAAGNPSQVTAPDGTSYSVQRTATGLISGYTDARGQSVSYSFNSLQQMTGKTLPGGATETYTYDHDGNLLTATGPSGTTTYTYNSSDQVTAVTYPTGLSMTFTYDSVGRRATATATGGNEVEYHYDDLTGQLTSLTNGSGGSIVSYTYTPDGQVATITNGNGTSTDYSYDLVGEVSQVVNKSPSGAVTSQYTYTRNAEGLISAVATPSGTTTYTHDADGSLTGAASASGTYSYTYNANGDRTASSGPSGPDTAYSVNGDDEYTSAGSTTYAYDSDGNLTSSTDASGTTTYTWNALNQLTGVTGPSGTTTYTYDALGTLISEDVNGTTTNMLTDPGNLDLFGTYSSSGSAQDFYPYGVGVVGQSTPTGQTSYFGFDGTGDVVSASDPSTGSVTGTYTYDPYGQVTAGTGPTGNPYQFEGQLGVATDPGTGWTENGQRGYDPGLGRFVSRDTVLATAGNPYDYASDDPVDYTDLTGLDPSPNQNDPSPVSAFFSGVVGDLKTVATSKDPSGGVYQGTGPNGLGTAAATTNQIVGGVAGGTQTLYNHIPGAGGAGAVMGKINQGTQVAGNIIQTGNDLYDTTHSSGLNQINNAENLVLHSSNLALNATPLGKLPGFSQFVVGSEAVMNKGYSFIFSYYMTPPIDPAPFGPRMTEPSNTRTAGDPNDMVGPAGYGSAGWVPGGTPLQYQVDFTNLASAEAPAQTVTVTEVLDLNLNLSTFSLGTFGFAHHVVTPPSGLHSYSATIDDTTVSGLDVDVSASLDTTNRTVTWTFSSIDPATGLPTTNAAAGFLPPDRTPPEGEASVSYSVTPEATAPTGTAILASASVKFDTNAPMQTGTALNTIDGTAPVASIDQLPATENGTFTLRWGGTDAGSGIATWNIYVSDDGGPLTTLESDTSTTSTTFTGQVGHSYTFYADAVDHVGNAEVLGLTPLAVTKVVAPALQSALVGYRMVAADGGIFAFGKAPFDGSLGGILLDQPIVGMATDPATGGYWLVARDGGVFAFDAPFYGSTGGKHLNQPIVGMAAAPDGKGYWLVAADGGIFSFGPRAFFHGSTGGTRLDQPIVGMATDPATGGYWLVARDGGVFAFDAPFYGSTGGKHLNQPIVGMAAAPDGKGYWLVAADGGIFSFGPRAFFHGSTGGTRLDQPIVGMATDPATGGYWLVARDGGVFAFDAPFYGSTGGKHLNQPIVGMAGP